MSREGGRESAILVYSSDWCGFCRAAERLLKQKGWDYTRINVDGNAVQRREMTAIAGRSSVPQIFFGDTHIGGFDDLAALEHSGELDELYTSTLQSRNTH